MGLEINGVLVARLKLPPFIATLGVLSVARGLSLVITQTRPIYFAGDTGFQQGVMGNLFGIQLSGEFGIPNIAIIMFAAVIVAAFILGKTVLGRYTFALGSNEEAARLSGVNVANWKMLVYSVCGLFAGLRVSDRRTPGLGTARDGLRLRAQRHLRGRHRRDLPEWWRGHDPRHHHRRIHRLRAHLRPAVRKRSPGVADRRDRRRRDRRGLHRQPPPAPTHIARQRTYTPAHITPAHKARSSA